MASLLCFLTSPHFCSVKEPGIQTPVRWLFWGISLPPSQSTDFLNKVIFLASISHLLDLFGCCVVSRVSLYSVTAGEEVWNRLVLRRSQPCPHLDLRCPASRALKETMPVVKYPVWGYTDPGHSHTFQGCPQREGRGDWRAERTGKQTGHTLARPSLPSTINTDTFQTMLPCRLSFTTGI